MMTIAEFQAWLDGFGEALNGAPTEAQWEVIKEKIATLRETAIPLLPGYEFGRRPQWWESPITARDNRTVPLHAH